MSEVIEYIARNMVLRRIDAVIKGTPDRSRDFHAGLTTATNSVLNVPALDLAPVRRARWEWRINSYDEPWYCTGCHSNNEHDSPYCPWCGAEMKNSKPR